MQQFSPVMKELFLCYDREQMVKFVNKQIQQLNGLEDVKCTTRFTIIKIKIASSSNSYSFTTDSNIIQFVFVLGKNFPITAPRVHIKNNLLKPGINDCRDYLQNILENDDWNYRMRLKQIQVKIPKFLASLEKNGDIFYNSRLGHLQLNSVYPIELITQLRGQNIFYSFQMMKQGDFKMTIIDVSATHLTIFTTKQQPYYHNEGFKIPAQKDISLCMLVFTAELGTLQQILVDRSNFSDIHLTFTSQKLHNLALQACTVTKKLKVKKGLNFLHKLLKYRKYYDLKETKLILSHELATAEEKKLLQSIHQSQQQIKHHLNENSARQLIQKYQAAIEYYSSNSFPYYQIYLDHITRLYERQEVRLALGTDYPALVRRSSSSSA